MWQLIDTEGQFIWAQQIVGGRLLQRDIAELSGDAGHLGTFIGRDFLQGQHLIQIKLGHQLWDHLLRLADYQQQM